MKFTLFLMFFITPPAPHPAPGEKAVPKIWTLQSTSSMEFATNEACYKVGGQITDSLEKTDTLTVRAWCFCEALGGERCPSGPPSPESATSGPSPDAPSVGVQTLRPPNSE